MAGRLGSHALACLGSRGSASDALEGGLRLGVLLDAGEVPFSDDLGEVSDLDTSRRKWRCEK